MSEKWVNCETGECKNLIEYTTEEQKIRNENYKKIIQKNIKMMGDYENFYFMLFKENNVLNQQIKNENIVRIIYLATYIDYDGYLKTRKKKIIKKSDLKEILNLSKNVFYDFFNEMNNLGIFEIENDGSIKLNSNNFKKGSLSQNDDGTRMFINTIRSLYENTPIKEHHQLGLAFTLLPFINKKYNIVCQNPTEQDFEKIKHLTLRDICDICGFERKRVRRMLKILMSFSFVYNGKHFGLFGYSLSGSDFYSGKITINPLISYRGNKRDYEEAVLFFQKSEKETIKIKERNDRI